MHTREDILRLTELAFSQGEIGWAGVSAGAISSKRPLLGPRGVQNHVIAGKR